MIVLEIRTILLKTELEKIVEAMYMIKKIEKDNNKSNNNYIKRVGKVVQICKL